MSGSCLVVFRPEEGGIGILVQQSHQIRWDTPYAAVFSSPS